MPDTGSVRLDRLESWVGQEVRVSAWVYNIRSSGKVVFLQIRDGYGWVQAVAAEKELESVVWQRINELTEESSVMLIGTVSKHPKRSEYELQVRDVTVVHRSEEFPISKKEHGVDFLMDQRHLWLRSKSQWAIQRVRNTIIKGIYDFMEEEGFTKIDSPILTPNACEGTTELFELDYFGDTAYLSQSGQLYIEAAIFSHRKVFDFGPVFRAEKSKTRRHLTEFWMMDAEVAFATHEDNMALQEKLIEYLVKRALVRNAEELACLERDTKPLEKIIAPFVRMTHAQAVKKLRSFGSDIKDGADLGGDDETLLMQQYDKPVIVERYPAAVKAFYMKRDPEDPSLALCDDMLAPEGYGEIIGGSEREDDHGLLLQRIREHNLPVKDFEWYLDLRKYGSVPHSGFGLGLERLVSWICGLKHLRESIPFPRTINRLRP
ncbi:MAG: asparagine--tRNA ligase [Candidatus Komeilibacteria bacterium]|nr:asparagine--tRNA ligase [Candidatus Komeilibacteria bacterium]